MTLRSSQYGTEVSRLGTDRSSMETLLLTCLQSQLMIARVNNHPHLTPKTRNEIIWEIEQVTKKGCFIDAKAD